MIHDSIHLKSASVSYTMSSARSSASPPAAEEEPRKKGSRGGKRSVTHLSKAQLARKRANDREAQRNIRQRTKEHIENLERKVKELEEHNHSSSLDRVIKRNKELEAEIESLRTQIASSRSPVVSSPAAADLPDDMLVSQKVEWVSEGAPCPWPGALPTHHTESPVSNTSNPSQMYPATTMGYDNGEANNAAFYAPTAIPIWIPWYSEAQHKLHRSSQQHLHGHHFIQPSLNHHGLPIFNPQDSQTY